MRVIKVLFVIGAALLSSSFGYEYAASSNRLIPNHSFSLPAGRATCWDWNDERVIVFAEAKTESAEGGKKWSLVGKATAYDPVTGGASQVEESICLNEHFRRANFNGCLYISYRDPQSADGRYFGKRNPSHWEWILDHFPILLRSNAGLFVLDKFLWDVASSDLVLVDEVEHVQLGEIPDSADSPASQLSFLHSRQGLVNVTGERVDWYDLANLRCSHRPWLWAIAAPFCVLSAISIFIVSRRGGIHDGQRASETAHELQRGYSSSRGGRSSP